MMQYICQDCGHQFEPGSEIKWTEAHGETFTGCPACGGAYEETVPCRVCGRHYDPALLCMDVCPDCLQESMTYDKVLRYLEARNYLANFMLEEYFDTPEPVRVSEKLAQALREMFLRAKANDLLCDKRELLDHCIAYIKQDMEDFSEWLQEEVKKVNERKRLEAILIKVSKEEKAAVADAAYRAGMTMSAYIRALLVKTINEGGTI